MVVMVLVLVVVVLLKLELCEVNLTQLHAPTLTLPPTGH